MNVDVLTVFQCRAARCSTVHRGHHHLRRGWEGALYPEGLLGLPSHQGKNPIHERTVLVVVCCCSKLPVLTFRRSTWVGATSPGSLRGTHAFKLVPIGRVQAPKVMFLHRMRQRRSSAAKGLFPHPRRAFDSSRRVAVVRQLLEFGRSTRETELDPHVWFFRWLLVVEAHVFEIPYACRIILWWSILVLRILQLEHP